MRVVTLVDRLVQGGAEGLAVDIVTRLDPQRFEPTLCVTRWSDPSHASFPAGVERRRREIEAAGVRFLGLTRRGPLDLLAWRPLVRLLRTESVDVVHSHMFGSNVWGVALGRGCRVPVIVAHEHSWAFSGERARRVVDRHWIARMSDALVACSAADRRRMIELERIDPDDIVLIANGIEARPPTPGSDIRRELAIAPDAPMIGSVGALRAEKRFDVLIDAAALLRRAHPGVRVVIAGDGDQRGALERRIERLGLGGTVMLLGSRTDVPDVLRGCDIAVNCSDFEGMPLSLLEYMDAGVAIVATRVGGIPSAIDDGIHGLLVPRRDARALADACAGLIADRRRRVALGAEARARRRAEFDLGTMVARIEQLYVDLRARPRSRRSRRAR
jgi:glycosyltransferase involved in cell wall biosynthesis